jgi:hypothetical protein
MHEPHFHESDIGFRARYLICYKERPYILEVHTQPTNVYKFKIFIILVYLYYLKYEQECASVLYLIKHGLRVFKWLKIRPI